MTTKRKEKKETADGNEELIPMEVIIFKVIANSLKKNHNNTFIVNLLYFIYVLRNKF